MTIRYSTNWMGPINTDWILKHGDCWCAGRIDVSATEENPWGDEIGLSPMLTQDWNKFSDWLDTFETDDIWTLEQLTEMYEIVNDKITWLIKE